MIAALRRVWAWLVLGLVGALAAVGLLWRRAARERDQAQAERDAARASAEREREVTAKIAAADQRGRAVKGQGARVVMGRLRGSSGRVWAHPGGFRGAVCGPRAGGSRGRRAGAVLWAQLALRPRR